MGPGLSLLSTNAERCQPCVDLPLQLHGMLSPADLMARWDRNPTVVKT